jgi:hypothetical protein
MVEPETQEEMKPAKEGSKSKAENTDTSKPDHVDQATEGKGEAKEKRKRGRKKKEEVEGSEEKEVKEEEKKEKGKGKKTKKDSEVVERKGERTSSRERKAVERFSVAGSPRSGSGKKGISIVEVSFSFVRLRFLICSVYHLLFRSDLTEINKL